MSLMYSNIDRYLAIWQAAHPGSWRDPKTNQLKKELHSLEDELRPFYKQDKTFWTSLDAEDTTVLGYTYADVKKSSEETKDSFRHRHSWSIRYQANSEDLGPTAPVEMEPLDLSGAQVFVNHPEYLRPIPPSEKDLNHEVDDQQQSHETVEQKRREWFVDDVVER